MKPKTAEMPDTPTRYAAQNAREGLINVNDLSLLTGVDAARLNRFAKIGGMGHYGEYHGKRFFNFEEIVNWLNEPDEQNEAKPVIRAGMEAMLRGKNCPYSLDKLAKNRHGTKFVQIVWKEFAEDC